MAARCPRCQRPTPRTSILPFLGIIASRLAQMAPGEPRAAPLPVRLRASHRPSGLALPAWYSPVHPRPPQPPRSLASAPAARGRLPDDIGSGQGARDWDHDPAAARGNRLSPGQPGSAGSGSITRRTSSCSDAGSKCRQRQPTGNSRGPFDRDCWVRTLDPLIKSHFGKDSIRHHRAKSEAITRLKRVWPVSILRVA